MIGTLGIIERDGEQYQVVRTERVQGCGSRFDGRMKFYIRRVSDGKSFSWLGSRHSKKVPHNARFIETTFR
jgi:hypothetical protein